MKLKLDLHDIYNRGQDIDRALQAIIDEAVAKKAPLVEIIPGKGSGQLKKRVLRFLEQKEVKALYHRVEKDSKNFGRLFVHFRWRYGRRSPARRRARRWRDRRLNAKIAPCGSCCASPSRLPRLPWRRRCCPASS